MAVIRALLPDDVDKRQAEGRIRELSRMELKTILASPIRVVVCRAVKQQKRTK